MEESYHDSQLPEERSDREEQNPLEVSTDRRSFLQKTCLLAAASVGLPSFLGLQMAKTVEAAQKGNKPSVIWLHFQECTGCTETLLRTTHPELGKLLLDMISLDYHETLLAAAGHQAEEALHQTMREQAGKYICVVEGAIPTKDGGVYCMIAGKPAMEMLKEVAANAAAIVAIGSCASFGGLPAADPNPTGARGVGEILKNKTVITIPGCPPNPYNFLGTVLQYLTFGTLPQLDSKARPMFAYGRTIHEHCPRRPHFDAGRFAQTFGDDSHRLGHCLYQLGCKGPQTHANCSVQRFGETESWPIGVGHPCVGCTEGDLLWQKGIHELADVPQGIVFGDAQFATKEKERPGISPTATGVAGLVGGALIGSGLMAAKKLGQHETVETHEAPDDK